VVGFLYQKNKIMEFFQYISNLGIIVFTLHFLWDWIIVFPATILFMFLKLDKLGFFLRIAGFYLMVSLFVILTSGAIQGSPALWSKLLYSAVGFFVLYLTVGGSMYSKEKEARMYGNYELLRLLRYDGLFLIGSMLFFVFALFVPQITFNPTTLWLIHIIDWAKSLPIIGFLLGIFGALVLLNTLFAVPTMLFGLLCWYQSKKEQKPQAIPIDNSISQINPAIIEHQEKKEYENPSDKSFFAKIKNYIHRMYSGRLGRGYFYSAFAIISAPFSLSRVIEKLTDNSDSRFITMYIAFFVLTFLFWHLYLPFKCLGIGQYKKFLMSFAYYYIASFVLGVFVFSNLFYGLNQEVNITLLIIPAIVIFLTMLFFFFSFSTRRLHDMGYSGFYSVFLLVPYLNYAATLFLFLSAGNVSANKFGLPEKQNFTRAVFQFHKS
jgi:uncharacterized membrane protein YhaH (DUF805 family)